MRSRFWMLLCAVVVAVALSNAAAHAQSCDDSNVCTSPDICADGTCSGSPVAGACDDGNECTANDSCANGTCGGTPISGGSCDDGNPCTKNDTCASGVCKGTIDIGATCGQTGCEGSCSAQGACLPDPDKQFDSCTDAFGPCTSNDVCLGTICIGEFLDCPDSDNNKCTLDFCNLNTGQCENLGAVPCGDCRACNSATGSCDPANEGGSCDDFNDCTAASACSDGSCLAVPTGTAEATATATFTATAVPTGTATATATATDTPLLLPTDTATVAPTNTATPLNTATQTPTGVPTGTATATATVTPTGLPTGTATATATATLAATATFTATAIPTGTATATATETPTGIPTGTATATATGVPTGTSTATVTPTGLPTGTATATATVTPTSNTPTATRTNTPTVPPLTSTPTVTSTPLPIVASILVGNATGAPGDTVSFEVKLDTNGTAMVAGTQNDIAFDEAAAIAAKENGKPDCTVNPAINKGDTTFAFLPSGCAPGETCTGIRAVVVSLSNLAPIADGAQLFTCNVALAVTASGDYPLTCSNPGAGDGDGNRLGVDCTSGTVTVAVPVDATITIGSINGAAGSTQTLSVTLNTAIEVAGTQNDITFPVGFGVVADDRGAPVCAVNPDIDKGATAFAFQPSGCTPGTDCTGVRALVLSISNVDPIADGSVLYTCEVAIANDVVNGTYPLECSHAGSSDPDGGQLVTDCINGQAIVGVVPTATETPTGTPSQSPSATPTDTPSPTPSMGTPTTPTATVTGTRTPTRTKKPSSGADDDSCAVVAPRDSSSGLVLLLPAAALVLLRRRRR